LDAFAFENYLFNITDVDSEIKIYKDNSYGIIKEKIKFELTQGVHNKIIRKISLDGTSDKLYNFKISSR